MILRSTWRKVSDILEELFDDNSDVSGSDSDGKKVKMSTLIGDQL